MKQSQLSKERFIAFKETYEALNQSLIEDFKTHFINFRNRLDQQIGSLEQLRITEAPDFNIFSILHMNRYEVWTHSPFLAEVLNPNGSHGQGNLFLSHFLSHLLGFNDQESEDPNWRVFREVNHVDIKLWNGKLKKAVYIENKIDTDAHSAQLTRYYKHWIEGEARGEGAFVFLTINGTAPSIFGFDLNEKTRYSREMVLQDLKLLSYRTDIAEWLRCCLPEIKASRVQYTVEQYIDTIKTL